MLARIYGVPIEVTAQEGRPVRFVWEGRLYTVQRIVDHWVTLRSNWSPALHERLPERAHWRVEAGSACQPGVFELRHDVLSGQWHLARVWD